MADITGKLLYAVVKKGVYEKLGTLKNDTMGMGRDLSDEEKRDAAPVLLNMVEKATQEFIVEMRQRVGNQ